MLNRRIGSMTQVVINIFLPNFQDLWSTVGGTFLPSYIYFSPIPPFGHKLIPIIDHQITLELISTKNDQVNREKT